MMMDRPKGIYEVSSTIIANPGPRGDIWGGSILLSYRTEILSMVQSWKIELSNVQMFELSKLHPDFFQGQHYLDALLRKLQCLDYCSLSQLLTVLPFCYSQLNAEHSFQYFS